MGFRSFRGTHPLSSCSALRVAWFLKIDPGTVSPRSKFEFSSCSRRSHENCQKIQEISNLGETSTSGPRNPRFPETRHVGASCLINALNSRPSPR